MARGRTPPLGPRQSWPGSIAPATALVAVLKWCGAGPAPTFDELRADIKRQQDAAQRQAEEAKARIEGRERRNAALARRGTVVSLSEQSARVAPEEGAGEAKGDT